MCQGNALLIVVGPSGIDTTCKSNSTKCSFATQTRRMFARSRIGQSPGTPFNIASSALTILHCHLVVFLSITVRTVRIRVVRLVEVKYWLLRSHSTEDCGEKKDGGRSGSRGGGCRERRRGLQLWHGGSCAGFTALGYMRVQIGRMTRLHCF